MVSVGYQSSRKLLWSYLIALFADIRALCGLRNDQKLNILIISKLQWNKIIQKSAFFSVFHRYDIFGHKIKLRLFSVISKFWFGSVSVLEKQCRSCTFGRSVK